MSILLLLSIFFLSSFFLSISAQSTISPFCTPSSTTCSFYSTCVESAIPCGSSGYAIGYGQKFCNLFTQNFNNFDANGKRWIDNVRFCLQNALLPEVALAAENKSPTCSALQNYAFTSHVNCYVNPTGSNLLSDSVCSLGVLDWAALLWTIKSAFVQAFSATITQVVNTLGACGSQYIAQVEVSFDTAVLSATVTIADVESAIAYQVATQMNWPANSVIAFPSGNKIIVALLATPDSTSSSSSTSRDAASSSVSPSSTANSLVNLINSASFPTSINGQSISLTSAVVCDGSCPSTMDNVQQSENTNGDSMKWIVIGVTVGVAVLLFAFIIFFVRRRKQNENHPATVQAAATASV